MTRVKLRLVALAPHDYFVRLMRRIRTIVARDAAVDNAATSDLYPGVKSQSAPSESGARTA